MWLGNSIRSSNWLRMFHEDYRSYSHSPMWPQAVRLLMTSHLQANDKYCGWTEEILHQLGWLGWLKSYKYWHNQWITYTDW